VLVDPSAGREDGAPAPVRAYRGTTSLAVGVSAVSGTCPGDRSSAGCYGPDPPGSTGMLALVSACSSGGSPVMAGSTPCTAQCIGTC